MERPEYRYPSNSSVIPAGYVCIPLEEYRDIIETCTVIESEEKIRDTAFEVLQDLLESLEKKNDELQAKVDEFDAFLRKEPYAQKLLDDYREYMKRKREAEEAEPDAEAEDA